MFTLSSKSDLRASADVSECDMTERGDKQTGCLYIYGGCDEASWRKNEAQFAPRGVVLEAFRDAYNFHCLGRHERLPAHVIQSQSFSMYVFVDGKFERLVSNPLLLSVAKPGTDKHIAIFSQLNMITRIGQKHSMADMLIAYGRGKYIPKTYTPNHPPPRNRRSLNGLWYLKPSLGSEGKGIVVVENPDPTYEGYMLFSSKPAVLQRGITNPMLINGHKFDVRVWSTLRGNGQVLIHSDGRLRVSSKKFKNSDSEDLSTHLTNVAVQPGGKWRNQFPTRMSQLPYYEDFVRQVRQIIVHVLSLAFKHKGIRCVQSQFKRINHAVGPDSLYHIIGWDFIMDARGKVWLLELNTRPGAHKADDGYLLYKQWALEAAAFVISSLSCTSNGKPGDLPHVPGLCIENCLPVST